MKALDVIFPHPVKILQLYCHTYVYTKEERSYSQRKENAIWDVQSMNGFIAGGELSLPEELFEDMDLQACSIITLEDFYYNKRGPRGGPMPSGLNRWLDLTGPKEIHEFRLVQGDALELYFNPNDKYSHPKREIFKVGDLKPGQPVEIKLNSKSFDPLRGTDRILEEVSYIFEYLGDFDRCHLLREPYDYVKKAIPKERKVVDLMQKLWM
ncbi:MAG: hypothetical protein K0Q79_3655 [Flavipsychrobacter sp.]|jgi:hypothetical protein|nr:hypothetical protein [Flavipsychrobacter sp.]